MHFEQRRWWIAVTGISTSLVVSTVALAIDAISPDSPREAGLLLHPLSAALTPIERDALQRRDENRRLDLQRMHAGARHTDNLALDPERVRIPSASTSLADTPALLAIDGDPSSAWRGKAGERSWVWSTSFRSVIHLALLRAEFGDNAAQGVPSRYRWEARLPVDGTCEDTATWVPLRGGTRDDTDPNEWLLGPRDIHARKQLLFADTDTCGLRLTVTESEGGPPVLREVSIHEGAASVTAGADVDITPALGVPAVEGSLPENVIASQYDRFWAGQPGRDRWVVTVTLPEVRRIDRISLMLGEDAVQVTDAAAERRRYAVAYMPLRYHVSTSPDMDAESFEPVDEAEPPTSPDDGSTLPVRRRLVHLTTPRDVRTLRFEVLDATDRAGVPSRVTGAPIIREIGLFSADDPRPVIRPPLFLSVNANPSPLLDSARELERGPDAHARMAFHRLRRIIGGFDVDSRWHPDPTRRRDRGAGRFLEAIDGDDPTLAAPLLRAMSPPPVVLLSGSLAWEFGDETRPWHDRTGKPGWTWDPTALPTDPDRGMGHLRSAVRGRVAPFVGFCGGAQILALLEGRATDGTQANDAHDGPAVDVDDILQRLDNRPIHGALTEGIPIERAWWFDNAQTDAYRPTIVFDPSSPLFDFSSVPPFRDRSHELPVSHVDMLRASAFQGPLSTLQIEAQSEVCGPWVDPHGGERTTLSPGSPSASSANGTGGAGGASAPGGVEVHCVRVPQAFVSRDTESFPLVGFQFHPEQRDFRRLAPGSPHEARGDGLNIVANTVDMVIDSYLRLYWPFA